MMLSDIELNILGGFFPRPNQRLLSVIQRQISYPSEEVYTTLKKLEQRKIIDIMGIGGTTVFTLHLDTDEAQDGYQFYVKIRQSEYRARYEHIVKQVDDYIKSVNCDIVLLGGSYAQGIADQNDPVYILGIVERDVSENRHLTEGKDPITSEESDKINIEYKEKYIADFKDMKISDAEYFREIVNFYFPLVGIKFYYEFLYLHIGV